MEQRLNLGKCLFTVER